MEKQTTVLVDDAPWGLDQLCTHFRDDHEFEVTVAGSKADIAFPGGVCAMTAASGSLHLRIAVEDAGAMPPVEGFMTSHLQRLVFKARKPVDWSEVSAEGGAKVDPAASKLRSLAAILDRAAAAGTGG